MERGMAQTKYLNCSACRWYDGQPYPNCLHVLSDWGVIGDITLGDIPGRHLRTMEMREAHRPCGPDGTLFESR